MGGPSKLSLCVCSGCVGMTVHMCDTMQSRSTLATRLFVGMREALRCHRKLNQTCNRLRDFHGRHWLSQA